MAPVRTGDRKPIQVGDVFIRDGSRWRVEAPYKVRGYWRATNTDGEERIFSGGTIALFRTTYSRQTDRSRS